MNNTMAAHEFYHKCAAIFFVRYGIFIGWRCGLINLKRGLLNQRREPKEGRGASFLSLRRGEKMTVSAGRMDVVPQDFA